MAGTRKTEKKKERLQKELPFEFKKASGFVTIQQKKLDSVFS